MAKTKEELKQLKEECEALKKKLKGLTEDELKEVIAGSRDDMPKMPEDEKYVMFASPVKPVPFNPPIYSKKCQHKLTCNFSSKDQCPYYSDEIGDCDK